MNQSKRIFLIRHTTPDVATGVCYGNTDVSLADNYTDERQVIADKCNGFMPDVVFCSPLTRCHRLAVDLFGDTPLHIDERLKEMHFGRWEMMRWNDISAQEIEEWSNNFFDIPTPDGESFKQLYNRVMEAWTQMIVNHPSQSIAVVTHSGVIRSLMMLLLDIPHQKVFNLALSFGAMVEVKWQNPTMYNVHFR